MISIVHESGYTSGCGGMNEFDPELLKVHLELAHKHLPGPDYYEILATIHDALRPKTYVEIGIRDGDSVRCSRQETLCIGIDPAPRCPEGAIPNCRIFSKTSDAFFEEDDLHGLLNGQAMDLAFIDGLHLWEQALRDFINVERFCHKGSLILLHDCIPLDKVTSDRVRTTHFYSGDVWKLTLCLRRERPDLKMVTVPTFPTGLTLVYNTSKTDGRLNDQFESLVERYTPMQYQDYVLFRDEMPPQIDNSRQSVAAWLMDAS